MSDHITVALTVRNLGLTEKSPLKKTFLSRLGIKSDKPSNEKRQIRLYKSNFFKGGVNPTSLSYDPIYASEIIENDTNIRPSILATISLPPADEDCRLRLYVFYTSSLTSKEILLAGNVIFSN